MSLEGAHYHRPLWASVLYYNICTLFTNASVKPHLLGGTRQGINALFYHWLVIFSGKRAHCTLKGAAGEIIVVASRGKAERCVVREQN